MNLQNYEFYDVNIQIKLHIYINKFYSNNNNTIKIYYYWMNYKFTIHIFVH